MTSRARCVHDDPYRTLSPSKWSIAAVRRPETCRHLSCSFPQGCVQQRRLAMSTSRFDCSRAQTRPSRCGQISVALSQAGIFVSSSSPTSRRSAFHDFTYRAWPAKHRRGVSVTTIRQAIYLQSISQAKDKLSIWTLRAADRSALNVGSGRVQL